MGRPLNKKYFGKRNPGATGTFGNTNLLPTDYDLGGSRVTGGTVGTAGSFASTTLGSPVIAASGAITFSTTTTALPAGTPIVVTGTNSGAGSITNATYYVAASPAPTATGVTLVTTSGGSTVATTTAGTPTGLSFTYTQFASYTFPAPVLQTEGATTAVGAPIYSIVSATVAAGGSGYANTATAFTVGNATLTITPSGGAVTGTVTVTTAGTFTAPLAAGPQALVGGTGTSGTVTITYGLVSGGTMSNQGNGYLANTVGTTYVKATTATASVSSVTSTISSGVLTVTAVTGTIANGMILTGGSVTAGAFIQYQLTSTASAVVSPTFSSGGQVGTNTITLSAGTSVAVGQIVTGTGLSAGTTVTAISGATATLSNYFTQQAAGTYNFYAYGGNGTYQLGLNNASGFPTTTTAITGTPTAGSVDLVTVTSTADMSAGMRFTPARTFGNLTGGTTYFVLAVLSSTTFTVCGTVGATSATAQSTTAAPTIAGTVTVAANGALSGFTSVTTALAAGTPVVITGDSSGFITNGTYYVAASPAATTTSMTLVTTPNGTTTATTSAGNANGTFTYYPAAPFGQYNVITVGGTGTSSPAATLQLQAQVTSGYVGMYPAIQAIAITVGEVARSESDIVKQENSQRFRVENQDGVAYCKLITSYPTGPGQMAIQATDSTGNLYWASRITNRQCVVTRQGTTGEFATGKRVNWVLGTAVLNTSVKLDNA